MSPESRTAVMLPPGAQCFVGDDVRRRRAIEERVVAVFEGWDYEEIIPPLFDYAGAFAEGSLGEKAYSFLGRDGSLLALRPDFTGLLAKIAAGRLARRPEPLRLYYSGEVLRYEPPEAGRQSELYQMGLEHLGGEPRAADAEVLAIAAESLESLGVADFVLAVGHVGVFAGLVDSLGLPPRCLADLRDRVEGKDGAGVREVLAGRAAPRAVSALAGLAGLGAEPSVLDEADELCAAWPAARAAVAELRRVLEALGGASLLPRVALDLGEVRGLDYYTGLVFRAYAPGSGTELGGGGRYDALLGRLGRPLPAVGFMLGLDRLALHLERSGVALCPARPQAERVELRGDLARALARARERRRRGVRVRFGNGGVP